MWPALEQDTVPRLKLEPVTPQSQVEPSTTELFNSNNHSFTQDKNICEYSQGYKYLSYPCYLTQAIMCGLFIGCIGTHTK